MTAASEPWPATAGPLDDALAALAAGAPIKRATEQLLLALEDGPAERVMQVLRESRGAWLPMSICSGGRALLFNTYYGWGDEGVPDFTGQNANIVNIISCVAYSTIKIGCTVLTGF